MVSDEGDESNSWTLRASCIDDGVDDCSKPRHQSAGMREDFGRNQHTSTGMVSDESTSRDNRCFVSNPQRAEQPVTPVMQSGSIDTIVVNKRNIDKCGVTNKCEYFKQGSKEMSNQWLSSAFSKITFGVWGKSKTGEEVTENVHANSKFTLTSMPEFNFSL